MILTYDILHKICPRLDSVRGVAVVAAINQVCPLYGINTADILHEFLANVIHESVQFTDYEENLNYTAKRLTEVWPTRFGNLTDAAPYANNPKKLANNVYSKRMGNVQANDGWDFRGSGPIQMTGRENFTGFTLYLRKKFNIIFTVNQVADLVRTDHVFAMHSACWIFAVSKSLIPAAINDNMKMIVKRINGGLIGYSGRVRVYELCKEYIK